MPRAQQHERQRPTAASSPKALQALPASLVALAVALSLGSVASQLGTSIANVTIAPLHQAFAASVSTIQWVSSGYLLALSMVVPLTGWAVERFGARRVWLTCLALVAGASLLCGAAWSIGSLIGFRLLQGAAGGMLLPLIRLILARSAGRDQMGRAMVFVALPGALTPALGPVLGGLLVSDLSWRWAYFINAPLCLIGLVVAWRMVPADEPEDGTGWPDLRGLALMTAGLGAVVYGLSAAGARGGFGSTAVIVGLALGAVLLAAYTVHAVRAGSEAIIDVRLFRIRSFTASSTLVFLLGGSLFGALFLVPLYYQQVRGASALHAGLMLAPLGFGVAISAILLGKVIDRTGAARATSITGMVVAAAGLVPYALIGPTTSQVLLSAAIFLTGLGLGAVILSSFTATYRDLSKEQVATATSAARILQQLGGVLGIAVLALIMAHEVAHGATRAAAFRDTFTWSLALTAFAVVPALLLPRAKTPASTGG